MGAGNIGDSAGPIDESDNAVAPATAPLDESVVADWQAVAAAVLRVQHRVDEAFERAGVPGQWFVVLHQLLQADDHRLSMSRLAAEVSMTTGGFTKLADRMAREGLIDRRGSSDDRRVVHAALTVDGLAMARLAAAVHGQALQTHVLDSMSRADLAEVARTLRDLAMAPHDLAEATLVEDAADAPRRRRDDQG